MYDSDSISIRLFSSGKEQDKITGKNGKYSTSNLSFENWQNLIGEKLEVGILKKLSSSKFLFSEEILKPLSELIKLDYAALNIGYDYLNDSFEEKDIVLFFGYMEKEIVESKQIPDISIISFYNDSNPFLIKRNDIKQVSMIISNNGIEAKGLSVLIHGENLLKIKPIKLQVKNISGKVVKQIGFMETFATNGTQVYLAKDEDLTILNGVDYTSSPRTKKEMETFIKKQMQTQIYLDIEIVAKELGIVDFYIVFAPNCNFEQFTTTYLINGTIE